MSHRPSRGRPGLSFHVLVAALAALLLLPAASGAREPAGAASASAAVAGKKAQPRRAAAGRRCGAKGRKGRAASARRRRCRVVARSASLAPPVLTVSGSTLKWGKVGTVTRYKLATKVPGKATAYRTVTGTSVTPPAVPGVTVSYGLRTDVPGSTWAKEVTIAYPAPTSAPALRVSGQTLTWNTVASVTRYVLATKVPGKATAYRTVSGTSVTPPAVPGATVSYGLRTDVSGSAWAREVSIAYPATNPVPEPPAGLEPSGFEGGIVSGADHLYDAKVSGRLGAKLVRVEWGIATPAANLRAAIAAHAANGTRVLPLAGFAGRVPSAAEARNLATWAREFGPEGAFWQNRSDGHLAVREIEFGNETSYGYQYGDSWNSASYAARARDYALRFKDAHQAIEAANPAVGLLAQADDGNTGSATWVNAMFAAVSDLDERVAGWTIHPYGPQESWQRRMDRMNAQLAAHDASPKVPVWITEWGISTDRGRCLSDNYGWNPCMTFDQAASALTHTVTGMRARYGHQLRAFLVFQGRDQQKPGVSTNREHYFGALTNDQSEKGSYSTAVRSLLAGPSD